MLDALLHASGYALLLAGLVLLNVSIAQTKHEP